jgi:5-methylcytosine-specific restriction endonuclease McrA
MGEAVYCSRSCLSAGQSTPGSKWSSKQPDKAAQREYMTAYVRRNTAKHNERSRAWAKANRQYRNFIQQVRRASGQITMDQWLAVFDRCGNACVACGAKDSLHVDHIVAVAVGGRTEPNNLQLLCGSCNSSKGVKPFAEWMLWRHGVEVLETKA